MDCRQGIIIIVFLLINVSLFGLGFEKNEVLDLSGKKVDYTLEVDHPKEIKILIMDSCSLTELPHVISALTHLEHLSLQYNPNLNLEQLSEVIKSLPKLRFLNLSHNEIIALPMGFGDLKISELKLSGNKLSSIDFISIVQAMPALQRLWIDGNQWRELPISLFALPKLRVLYAYNNQISTIELKGSLKTSLRVLHLGSNAFEELPVALTLLKGLRMALFNQNQISSIPQVFGTNRYSMNALILDANPLGIESRTRGAKCFKKMMMYSDK